MDELNDKNGLTLKCHFFKFIYLKLQTSCSTTIKHLLIIRQSQWLTYANFRFKIHIINQNDSRFMRKKFLVFK